MVEPAALGGEHEDASGAQGECEVESELEVGRVLLLRMALDAHPRCLCDSDGLGGGRVEVAYRHGHVEAERERVLEALVGGDHRRPERHLEGGTRSGEVSP